MFVVTNTHVPTYLDTYSSDPNKRAYPNKRADWNGYLIGYARLLGFY